MLYTGLDLHRSFSYITTMNEKGEIVGQKKLPSNGEVVEFLKEFDDTMEVAIEATPSWYWLSWVSVVMQQKGLLLYQRKQLHPLSFPRGGAFVQ